MKIFQSLAIILLLASNFTYAQVVADFTYSGIECADSNIFFINQSTGAVDFEWDFGDFNTSNQINPIHTYNFKNTYQVRLIAKNGGQRDTAIKFIFISSQARSLFTVNNFTNLYCVGSRVDINNSSQNFDSLLWDFGDGFNSNKQNVSHQWPAGSGSYNLELIAYGSCGNDTSSRLITFSNDPQLVPRAILNSPNLIFCPGELIQFSQFSRDYDSIRTYFGDGTFSTATNPSHSYTNPGVYDVVLVAYNTCGLDSSFPRTVEVSNTKMSPIFAFASPFNGVCPGDSLTISSGTQVKQMLVNFGDGTLQTFNSFPIKYAYSQTGSYNIQILGENICGAKDTVTINYQVVNNKQPLVSFNAQPFSPCPGEEVTLTNFSQGLSSIIWKLGDGTVVYDTSLIPIKHTYAGSGSFSVTAIGINGCGLQDSTTRTVTVGNSRAANAFFSSSAGLSAACYDTPISFQAFGQSSSHLWEFGDGDTSHQASPTHTYAAAGTYLVVHTVTNACGNSASRAAPVILNNSSNPSSTFRMSPLTACPGDSIRLTLDLNSRAGTGHYFVMGNGDFVLSSEDTAWYVYPSGGQFNVELIDTNACGYSYDSDSIIISPSPSVSFTFNPSPISAGDTVEFTPSGSGAVFLDWQFDTLGTSLDLNPKFVFGDEGEYTIRLRSFSSVGCEGLTEQMISVGPPASILEQGQSHNLYPNPSNGMLYLSAENKRTNNIKLIDFLGRNFEVKSSADGRHTSIDLSSVPNGTYLLEFELDDERVVEKVVVVR